MIKFTVGEMPSPSSGEAMYRAYMAEAEKVSFGEFAAAVAKETGMNPALAQAVLAIAWEKLAELLAQGRRVDLGEAATAWVSIKGAFDTLYEDFDPARHHVCAHIQLKGAYKNRIAQKAAAHGPENATPGEKPAVLRVLDVESRTDGTVKTRQDGTLPRILVSGKGLSRIVEVSLVPFSPGLAPLTGRILSATATTLDCDFADAPVPGAHTLLLAAPGLSASRRVQIGES